MPGRIITPQDFTMARHRPQPQALDVQRRPMPYQCECGRKSVLLFPKFAGSVVWQCSCGRDKRINFDPPGLLETPGEGAVTFYRKPLDHLCQTEGCGEKDIIVLPSGVGEMRWGCKCGNVWIIKFDEKQGRLGKVL